MNTKRILFGITGGLAGGLVFGMMMGMMGMLPMIGKMVGVPSAGIGFFVHMVISALIGAGFVVLLGRFATGIGSGIWSGSLYGVLWWVLGPLTLMPLFTGMGLGVHWNLTAATKMMPSLIGHIIYGVILGCSFGWLQLRAAVRRTIAAPGVSSASGS